MVGRDGNSDAAERLPDLCLDRRNHEANGETDNKQAGGDGPGHRIAQRADGHHGRRWMRPDDIRSRAGVAPLADYCLDSATSGLT